MTTNDDQAIGQQPQQNLVNSNTKDANKSAHNGHDTCEKTISSIARMRRDADAICQAFETGEYPCKKMPRKPYEQHITELQAELLKA